LFSFFYVIRQTILNSQAISWIIIILYLAIVIVSIPSLLDYFKSNAELCFLLVWSISFSYIIFLETHEFIKGVSKFLLFLCFYVLNKRFKEHVSFYMATGFSIAVLSIWGLIIIGYIPQLFIENDVWKKNNFGFINPNVGSFFTIAILYGFWESKKSIIPYVVALSFVLYIFYDFYSRTEIIVLWVLLLLYIGLNLNIKRSIFFKYLKIIIVIFMIYSILYFLILIGVLNTYREQLVYLNVLTSNRIYDLLNASLIINWSGPIINLDKVDGVIYELIVYGGPLITFLFAHKIYLIYKYNRNVNYLVLIAVILLVGIFEGILNKLTILGSGILKIINYKMSINLNLVKRENFLYDTILQIRYLIATVFLIIILLFYLTPVYEVKIKGFNVHPNVFENAIVQSKSDLVCKKMKFRLLKNGQDSSVLLTTNSETGALNCAISYENLVVKDIRDKKLDPLYIVNLTTEFKKIEKENLLRYIFAALFLFSIFLFKNFFKFLNNKLNTKL